MQEFNRNSLLALPRFCAKICDKRASRQVKLWEARSVTLKLKEKRSPFVSHIKNNRHASRVWRTDMQVFYPALFWLITYITLHYCKSCISVMLWKFYKPGGLSVGMETFGHNVVYSAKKEKNANGTLVRNCKQRSLFCTGYAQREKRWVTTIQPLVGWVKVLEGKKSYLFFQTSVNVKWVLVHQTA